MFSMEQKQEIAAKVEELLLALNHPEMPDAKPGFTLSVKGAESWSWAEIRPNWTFNRDNPPGVNFFNEINTEKEDG